MFSPSAYRLTDGLASELRLSSGEEIAEALRFADENPNRAVEALNSVSRAKTDGEARRRRTEAYETIFG